MREWAQMRVSGFLGWLHKLVMFLTWPFRHWKFLLLFILITATLIISVPLILGVNFSSIPDWYQAKMTHPFMTVIRNNVQNIKQATEQKLSQSVNTVKDKMQKIAPEIMTSTPAKQENKEKIRFTAWNVAKFNTAKPQQPKQKVSFKAPTFAELKEATPQRKRNSQETAGNNTQSIAAEPYYEGKLDDYYTVRRDLDLIYLTESEKLYGHADVVGPNSLYLENTYVYLYGIYTNPEIYNEQSAQLYLEKLIDNQPVHCDIIAYSVQSQTPTALCFLNGRLINQELVDAEYAANIALK